MLLTTGFTVPTLPVLIDRISSDINTRIPGQDARIRWSLLWVLARVIAGACWCLYGFQTWIMNQVFPDTATDLVRRHATIWGVTPLTATKAQGLAIVYGVAGSHTWNGGGAVQTTIQTVAGVQYTLDADEVIPIGGHVHTAVTAVLAGDAGNTIAGTVLTFVSPPAGITAIAAVDTGDITGGTDDESDADLQARVLEFIRNRPHGGDLDDYEVWAREVAGVERAWVYGPGSTGSGTVAAGDVKVLFATTGTGSNVIPAAPLIATVQAYLDARRPVTADVTAAAPVAHVATMHIHLTPNTAAVQAAVTAEIEALLLASAVPGGTIPNSQIHEAVSRAAGEISHTFVDVDGLGASGDFVAAAGDLIVLGAITW